MTITNDLAVLAGGAGSGNGNVGIGTSSPGNALTVARGTGTSAYVQTTSGSDYSLWGQAAGTGALAGTFTALPFLFYTNNAERMRIDASGNMGIGGTPPSDTTYKWLNIFGPTTSGGGIVQLNNSDSSVGINMFCTNLAGYVGTSTSHPLLFRINSNEVARFDPSGNLLVGTPSANFSGSGFTLSTNSGTTKWLVGPTASSPSNFYVAAGSSVGVYLAGTSATSWTSGSDERLKNIIEPIENGLQKVNTLRAIIGSYKADEEKTRRPFLIAQDLQKVLPEAVDASNPDALGVQYTEVIPLLVAAIQELSAKNDALEARLAALENK